MPKLIAFIPHPDDESYSFGGTIALLAKAGWECFIECASYGERGKRHDGGPVTPNAVAEVREAELKASCELLGARAPVFWGLPDGEMGPHRGERQRIERLTSKLQPELLLTLGVDGAYGHPDHIALHRWVFETWENMADPRPALLFPVFSKGLFLPQYEKCLRMMGDPPEPPAKAIGSDTWHYEIPIAGVQELKLASIAAHRSQLPGGNPEAIFPPGIVSSLREVERFEDATGVAQPCVAELFDGLARV
jgi:N-acetyl-1-D-myo-inositol-2-amino-2-deoxy-alpha-D-glucopyranoside deacetylase